MVKLTALLLLIFTSLQVHAGGGLFGKDETREQAYDKPIYSGVFKIDLDGGGWCTAFLIDRQWAVTAHHCIVDSPIRAHFEYTNAETKWGWTTKIDKTWNSYDYEEGDPIYKSDWGLIHLQKPAPEMYRAYKLARPDQITEGMPAMSIGYPSWFVDGGSVRVEDEVCRVEKLVGDSILSDCNMSRGNSGGPLLVKLANGEWVAAGVCSTQYMYSDGTMVVYEDYTDEKANHWTNISKYLDRVHKTWSANRSMK